MEAAEQFPNATPISDAVLDDALAAEQPAAENNAAQDADAATEPYTPALILRGCEVIPRPDDIGKVVAVDRREIIMPDAAAFAAKMNQKIPKIRVDMDHRTEPGSYDYKPHGAPIGTRADGWASNFREQNGALVCDLELNAYAANEVRGRAYRYLSPTVNFNISTRHIANISSIALTNNPALANTEIYSAQQKKETPMTNPTDTDANSELFTAQQRIATLESEVAAGKTAAIAACVANAAAAGKVAPAETADLESFAVNHKDGLDAGLAALETAIANRGETFAHLAKKTDIHIPKSDINDPLNTSELRACRLLNIRPEAFREIKKVGEGEFTAIANAEGGRDLIMKQIGQEAGMAGVSANEIYAAAVTPDLIADLTRGFSNAFNTGFARAPMLYTSVCMVVMSTGKGETYGFMEDFPEMAEWTGDRAVKTITSKGKSYDNNDYELSVGLKANDIADDTVGVYMPIFRRLGEAAGAKMDALVRDIIIAGDSATGLDGQYFFDTDHPAKSKSGGATTYANRPSSYTAGRHPWILLDLSREYKPFIMQIRQPMRFVARDSFTDENYWKSKEIQYGVDCRMVAGYGLHQLAYLQQTALTADNVYAAIEKMRGQLGADGKRPLGVNPTHILYGPELEQAGHKLFKLPGASGTEDNSLYKRLDVIDSDWLAGHTYS